MNRQRTQILFNRVKYFQLTFAGIVCAVMAFGAPAALFAADPPSCSSLNGTCRANCAAGEEMDFTATGCAGTESCCTKPPATTKDTSGSKNAPATVSLDNPISVEANPSQIIGLIIKSFLGVVGGVALVMMVWGGFQWLTSAGNPEKVKKGSGTMMWAIIGLILVLGSYVLVGAAMNFLAGAGG